MTSTLRSSIRRFSTPGDTADDTTVPTSHRLDETREAVSRLVAGAQSIDAGRVLLRVGAVATPLGLLFIVLGYWGAAHAAREIEQTPYLISGGLLGVALVLAGGFAYFGYWLSRGVAQQERIIELLDRHTEELAARVASDEDRLGEPRPGRPQTTRPDRAASAPGGELPALLVTPTGSIAHRPDCPVVANRSDTTAVHPHRGLQRCKICRPLDPPA